MEGAENDGLIFNYFINKIFVNNNNLNQNLNNITRNYITI